jgi:hypothetical protein
VTSQGKNAVRAVVVVALLAALGWYLFELSTSGNRLEVTIVNQTGGPLTKLVLGDGTAIDRLDDKAASHTSMPLTREVALTFVGADGRIRKSRYAFTNSSGIKHTMRIVLNSRTESERLTHTRSTILLGAEVEYEESIDFIDSQAESRSR